MKETEKLELLAVEVGGNVASKSSTLRAWSKPTVTEEDYEITAAGHGAPGALDGLAYS